MTDRHAGLVRITDDSGGCHGHGFVVASGLLVTCTHVVQNAMGASEHNELQVSVEFPFVSGADEVWGHLHLVFDGQAELARDLTVLRLHDAPLSGDSALAISEERPEDVDEVLCWSAPDANNPHGTWVEARSIEQVPGGRYQLVPRDPNGPWIEPGYSGTPVFHAHRKNVVCGVITNVSEGEKLALMAPVSHLRALLAQVTHSAEEAGDSPAGHSDTPAERRPSRPIDRTDGPAQSLFNLLLLLAQDRRPWMPFRGETFAFVDETLVERQTTAHLDLSGLPWSTSERDWPRWRDHHLLIPVADVVRPNPVPSHVFDEQGVEMAPLSEFEERRLLSRGLQVAFGGIAREQGVAADRLDELGQAVDLAVHSGSERDTTAVCDLFEALTLAAAAPVVRPLVEWVSFRRFVLVPFPFDGGRLPARVTWTRLEQAMSDRSLLIRIRHAGAMRLEVDVAGLDDCGEIGVRVELPADMQVTKAQMEVSPADGGDVLVIDDISEIPSTAYIRHRIASLDEDDGSNGRVGQPPRMTSATLTAIVSLAPAREIAFGTAVGLVCVASAFGSALVLIARFLADQSGDVPTALVLLLAAPGLLAANLARPGGRDIQAALLAPTRAMLAVAAVAVWFASLALAADAPLRAALSGVMIAIVLANTSATILVRQHRRLVRHRKRKEEPGWLGK